MLAACRAPAGPGLRSPAKIESKIAAFHGSIVLIRMGAVRPGACSWQRAGVGHSFRRHVPTTVGGHGAQQKGGRQRALPISPTNGAGAPARIRGYILLKLSREQCPMRVLIWSADRAGPCPGAGRSALNGLPRAFVPWQERLSNAHRGRNRGYWRSHGRSKQAAASPARDQADVSWAAPAEGEQLVRAARRGQEAAGVVGSCALRLACALDG